MIATEPLPRDLMDRLFPTDRIVSDTRRVVYYYRASPDRSRGFCSADASRPPRAIRRSVRRGCMRRWPACSPNWRVRRSHIAGPAPSPTPSTPWRIAASTTASTMRRAIAGPGSRWPANSACGPARRWSGGRRGGLRSTTYRSQPARSIRESRGFFPRPWHGTVGATVRKRAARRGGLGARPGRRSPRRRVRWRWRTTAHTRQDRPERANQGGEDP